MKKFFLFLLLLATGLPALAQIEKGNVMLGGSLYGSWNRNESNNSQMLPSRYWGGNVSPSVGYFVAKGLALGVVTGYDRSWSRQSDPRALTSGARAQHKSRSSSFSLGPEVHYYIMLGDKLAFYAQTSLSWGKLQSTNSFPITSSGGVTTQETQRNEGRWRVFAAGPGLAYFLGPHVAVFSGLTYRNHRYVQETSETSSGTTSTTDGVYLNVGARLFLGGQ
jgi:hypothetical protein